MSESQHSSPAPEAEHDDAGAAHSPAEANTETTAEEIHVDRYESAWMRISVIILAIFFLAITVSGFAVGFQLPGVYERVDPASLHDEGSPFADPGLRELAPGEYELYIRAQIWSFTPNEVRVPAGSTVTFYVTSQDVQHGLKLTDTNINMMILPGQISSLTAKFEEPGTYQFICHEYCGQLHHTMYGRLIVEEAGGADTTEETAETAHAAAALAPEQTGGVTVQSPVAGQ